MSLPYVTCYHELPDLDYRSEERLKGVRASVLQTQYHLLSTDNLTEKHKELKQSKAALIERVHRTDSAKIQLLQHAADFKALRYEMQETLTRTDFTRINLRNIAFNTER